MDESQPIQRRLEALGFEVEQVSVKFVGLYDTVSSHGLSFTNDTATLKLDAVRHAEKVIQLAAADEHRKNFSLTNISSAGAKGEQYFLPGAHSDVGGGYVDGAPEKQTIFVGLRHAAIAERRKWIADGWYKENEISNVSPIITRGRSMHLGPVQAIHETIKVNREEISNAYALIPLRIMARVARENGINIARFLELDTEVRVVGDLKTLEDKIEEHIAQGASGSSAASWHGNTPLLKRIRNQYLHVSAHYSFGMEPRFKKGKRYRVEHYG